MEVNMKDYKIISNRWEDFANEAQVISFANTTTDKVFNSVEEASKALSEKGYMVEEVTLYPRSTNEAINL